MMEKQSILDRYENLKYDKLDLKRAQAKLSEILEMLAFQKNDDFSKRFLEMATVIEKNLPFFQFRCRHVDTITTIIEYLNYYGMKFAMNKLDKSEEEEEVTNIIKMIFIMNVEVKNFSMTPVIIRLLGDHKEDLNSNIKHHIINTDKITDYYSEIIVLEDSDLHAVTKEIKNCIFNKIWIQEPLVSKLSSFINECKLVCVPFDIFRSKQELLNSTAHSKKFSLISIWSEDIIAVKDLAASLNRDVIFINSFMDMYGSIIYFPRQEKSQEYKYIHDCTVGNKIVSPKEQITFEHNLFYDGMWQKPVKDTYWFNEGHLWANTTNEDFERCIAAAKKGANIWSARSIDSRIQVLSKLVYTLKCNNKFELANIISKLTKSLHFYENSQICPQRHGRLEVTVIRKPHGIITLKAKDLNVLFWQLTLALIAGNSVIVLCNSVYCTLEQYCDMFSASGIPPGVINMLSIERMEYLSYPKYEINESKFFSQEGQENLYMKFTIPKIIVLPVK